MPQSRQLGQTLAKALGIKLDDPDTDNVTRGESVFSTHTTDSFIEQQPTSAEWIAEVTPSGQDMINYVKSLFPFLSWIGFYNLQWFLGDLVAGITIGAVVVPQGMAYAKLANLPVQFGLYSSFMGVLIYWFFATSKDITIGPVAVVSTVTGTVVSKAIKEYPEYADEPWVIASALALISGCIVLFIGLIRCGWIVELIPLVSLAAFMTGSAINIAAGQVPTLMGISGFSTRDSTYLVIINTLKNLGKTDLNAAMGLTALTMLYLIRFSCAWAAKKFPNHHKLFFFLSTLRAVFVILLYTMISWLVNMHRRSNPAFAILKDVPRGFQHAAVPKISTNIIRSFISELPATVIVLLIEHIAISKSFGRVNNYIINPSQEMVAIGVTNVLAPFLGGYPSTGSFSRTAIKSKAGVRTPFAGVITAVVVLLAIYALTAVFFYIPSASLAAVIIHAVGDLITSPNTLYKFWRISPIEVIIFFVGVFVTIFSTIENGIYATICISFAVFMFRVLKSRGRFLGRVQVHSVLGDHLIGNDSNVMGGYGTIDVDSAPSPPTRNVFLPIDHGDGSNPQVEVASPYPGIFIYRFSEGFNYPSASHTLDYLTSHIFANTRRNRSNAYSRPGDRPWNDPGPKKGQQEQNDELPTLKAIIFDFSSVNNVDVTSVQQLIDVRNQLDRYAAPEPVDFHFACINNRWTKRGLVSAGFGYPTPRPEHARWKSIFSVAEIGGSDSAAAAAELEASEKEGTLRPTISKPDTDIMSPSQNSPGPSKASSITQSASKSKAPEFARTNEPRKVVVHGLNRPLFHIDLTSALQSSIANVRAREEVEAAGGPDIGVDV
ncbi:putative sulfate permease [Annulohypoxylon truncatum]|uniref:putative sulfate permease n=1 Tax=Annulohypoxylon truncatum TaxID=327061 RepID=UPI0020078811|nr:putative sulfate permease [Annulohypoxylon truncatum]KAI1213889.1 putative sulfate permease [Annulohypoxylon truncatum]